MVHPVSLTYVNVTLPESHHFSFFFPREVLSNLSRPFFIFSLDLHESTIPRVQSSLDSKSMTLCA
jgi:hypothetical protein